MITFGCHTWSFPDLTLTEALGTIARLGFRYADIGSGQGINLAQAAQQPRAIATDIKNDLALYNLALRDFYLMLPRISLADDDRREREIDTFVSLLPFMQALGVPGVTISPGVSHNLTEDPAAQARTLDSLRRMTAAAQTVGIALSFTPHVDSMATTPDAVRGLLQGVEGLGLTLDWASLSYYGAKYNDIAALITRCRHMQMRGAGRGQLQMTSEKSKFDLRLAVEDSVIANYDGTISLLLIQAAGRHKTAKVNAIAEISALRGLLRQARDETLAKRQA